MPSCGIASIFDKPSKATDESDVCFGGFIPVLDQDRRGGMEHRVLGQMDQAFGRVCGIDTIGLTQ